MSQLIRRATVLVLGLPFVFLPVGRPDATAGGADKARVEVDRCVYMARGHAADHHDEGDAHATDPARPSGVGGGGGATKTCAKTFAKWAASSVDVYVDDSGAPSTVGGAALSTLVANVVGEWSCHSGIGTGETLSVHLVDSAVGADITVAWGNLGSTGILGQAATSYFGGVISHSAITMNTNQSAFLWTEGPAPSVDAGGCAIAVGNGNTASSNYDLLSVLLHEFGHSLGLSHPNNRCRSSDGCYAETMYSCTDAEEYMRRAVNPGDETAITSLYGSNP